MICACRMAEHARSCRVQDVPTAGNQMALPAPAGDDLATLCAIFLAMFTALPFAGQSARRAHRRACPAAGGLRNLTTHADDRSGRTAGAAPRAGAAPGVSQRCANRRERRERPERPLTR